MMQKRFFNTIGYCKPEKHYLISPLRGLESEIMKLIENELYFVIHAPRQSGKTTFLHSLAKKINLDGKYVALAFSIERAGYDGITMKKANETIINSIWQMASISLKEDFLPPEPSLYTNKDVHEYLSAWSKKLDRHLVLFIDEIDSVFDNILVSLLRQLRDGFQIRPGAFPASVALVGLRDVREYKTRVREDDRSIGSGSPFNIKAESFRLENFTRDEVAGLYQQYTDETGQAFTDDIIDLLYEYTGGQPWLVNAMAREITEKILKNDYRTKITVEIAQQAKENLIQRRDTHLDSLMDKLEDPRVKNIVSAIITGETLINMEFNNDLEYTKDLGIVVEKKHKISISNRIYNEIIPRMLNYQLQSNINYSNEELHLWFIKNGKLQMDLLLKEFQKFYRRHSESWTDRFSYHEAGKQLLLMAFLQRVVNGGGQIDREMALGSTRCDMAIEYGDETFALELKVNHDQYTREDGLGQLSGYLDKLGLMHGYLIIFEKENSRTLPWETRLTWENIEHEHLGVKRKITIVGM